MEIEKEVQKSVRDIISKRLKARRGKHVMMTYWAYCWNPKSKKSSNMETRVFGTSIDEVVEECKLFYFAGRDHSVLLVWTLVLLSTHSDWQARARGDLASSHDLYEVLRLYPPVVALARRVHEEMRLRKLLLPVGTVVSLPTVLLHHDHEIWGDDAMEFKPERFSERVSNAQKKHALYFPFGRGTSDMYWSNILPDRQK
ncbi:cytochrome P450 CYP72A219-like [Olea europaea subsp. europaea]|uniref:Cytochrome P450 CYP72A219-like n=1 Tax=Olea europaea subsp. europaea TaxID=158383 RepID=A0A8S0V4I5_OLEEU|nr:cytochrome P450 CYP72A219-like [Olea europaea subsp. europaea]